MTKFALPIVVLLAGCAVGTDYEAPKLGLPLGWLGLGENPRLVSEGEVVKLDWWKAFNDPVLDGLMQQALERNGDLRVAQARVLEARGARLAAQASLLPSVSANAQGGRGNANATGRLTETSAATLDASWEIDLFGGNRRAAEAALARLGGTEAEARLTRMRLMAEVAIQYLDVRRLQQQLEYARKNLDDQSRTLELVRAQFNEGVVSQLLVAQNEALVGNTAAAIPLLEASLTSVRNGLGVLVGAQPVEIARTVGSVQPVPVSTPQVLVDTPANVIARRPDVMAAERALAAATADQGVAFANWFPRISLTGLFGLQNFGSGTSEAWSAGGVVSLPLIDFGRVRALVRQADARQMAALATYEQTILLALADVETSLNGYVKAVERRQRLLDAAEASRNALRLAKLQYTEGVASNLDVIIAEQQQLSADDLLASGEAAVGQNLAILYKALGGE
ncbi:MAG: efflux transporter outer membrane subunit [Alphaproteobacteria bacterium]|nr:MAG: efflux transporter outer membrane subunit [Alphaproteobacteria bacterium]